MTVPTVTHYFPERDHNVLLLKMAFIRDGHRTWRNLGNICMKVSSLLDSFHSPGLCCAWYWERKAIVLSHLWSIHKVRIWRWMKWVTIQKVENIVNKYYYNDIMGRYRSILIFIGHILNYLYMNALKDYWLLYKIIACVDFNDKHFQTYGGKWIHKLFWIRRPCHANHLVYN